MNIIEELRHHEAEYPELIHGPLCGQAADRIEELEAALRPFAGDKLPEMRRTKIDYDKHGLRRSISPMEIACRDAAAALTAGQPK